MAPAIRVVVLFLLAGALPFSTPLTLFAVAGSLLLLTILLGSIRDWLLTSLRLRWLFVSIIVLFLWFTPGPPLFEHAWLPSPTVPGTLLALQRCSILVLLIGVVRLVISVTPRDQLVGALLWLGAPLRYVGLPHERLAVRIALCLEFVADVQAEIADTVRRNREARTIESSSLGTRLSALGAFSAKVFADVEQRAVQGESVQLELAVAPPPATHWCYVITLGLSLWVLNAYG